MAHLIQCQHHHHCPFRLACAHHGLHIQGTWIAWVWQMHTSLAQHPHMG